MLGNIKYTLLALTGLFMFSACQSAAQSGSTASPTASESDVSIETVSEEPAASPTTVDLSNYDEIALPQLDEPADGEEIAVLTTSMGIIKLRFFPDYAQKAVQNFKTHAKAGYYDGALFHRVIDEFMIQTGDPTGTGKGGNSIWGQPFEMEITPELHHIRGALGMARGQDEVSQGSQFYIVQNKALDDATRKELESYKDIQDQVVAQVDENNQIPMAQMFPTKIIDEYLTNGGVPGLQMSYTVFGQVTEGMDVVDKIAAVETSQEEETKDRPLEDIILEKITFEPYKS
ncbi:MAG: peptidylprolyl isomerase [Clostridiales bacterium]|jgi:cyclophilin family peptidyl-prolyl cis-trans isomerase|nr:peptidylprolyl isomerase [Clostridiales bacterium]